VLFPPLSQPGLSHPRRMVVRMFGHVIEELSAVASLASRTTPNGDVAPVPSGEQLSEVVTELQQVRSMLDAVQLLVLGQWDESLAWAQEGMRTPTAWLRHQTGVAAATARRQTRLAKFLTRRREVAQLLAEGAITVDHVSPLEQIDLPRVRDLFDAHLDELLDHARDLPADDFAKVCSRWLQLADTDGADPDRRRFERRRLHLSQELRGNWKLDANLLDDIGAMLDAEIARISQEQWEAEQRALAEDPSLVMDLTPAQRRADAFAELIRRAIGVTPANATTRRPSLSVVIDEDALRAGLAAETEAGDWLSGSAVRQVACDSELYTIVMRQGSIPINLGRTARLATPEQRRVIIARDRTCVWSGCDAPPRWCDIHHLDFWEDDGHTDVDRMCLLCSHHHTLVHHGGWTLDRDLHGNITLTDPRGSPPPDRRRQHRARGEALAVGFADLRSRNQARRARRRIRDLVA